MTDIVSDILTRNSVGPLNPRTVRNESVERKVATIFIRLAGVTRNPDIDNPSPCFEPGAEKSHPARIGSEGRRYQHEHRFFCSFYWNELNGGENVNLSDSVRCDGIPPGLNSSSRIRIP
jgi:hypothetical protein